MTAAMLSSPACVSQILNFSAKKRTVFHSLDIAKCCATFSWSLADFGRSITSTSSSAAVEMASMSSGSAPGGAVPGGAAPGGAAPGSGSGELPAAPGGAVPGGAVPGGAEAGSGWLSGGSGELPAAPGTGGAVELVQAVPCHFW